MRSILFVLAILICTLLQFINSARLLGITGYKARSPPYSNVFEILPSGELGMCLGHISDGNDGRLIATKGNCNEFYYWGGASAGQEYFKKVTVSPWQEEDLDDGDHTYNHHDMGEQIGAAWEPSEGKFLVTNRNEEVTYWSEIPNSNHAITTVNMLDHPFGDAKCMLIIYATNDLYWFFKQGNQVAHFKWNTFELVAHYQINIAIGTFDGCIGLAKDPETGTIYVAFKHIEGNISPQERKIGIMTFEMGATRREFTITPHGPPISKQHPLAAIAFDCIGSKIGHGYSLQFSSQPQAFTEGNSQSSTYSFQIFGITPCQNFDVVIIPPAQVKINNNTAGANVTISVGEEIIVVNIEVVDDEKYTGSAAVSTFVKHELVVASTSYNYTITITDIAAIGMGFAEKANSRTPVSVHWIITFGAKATNFDENLLEVQTAAFISHIECESSNFKEYDCTFYRNSSEASGKICVKLVENQCFNVIFAPIPTPTASPTPTPIPTPTPTPTPTAFPTPTATPKFALLPTISLPLVPTITATPVPTTLNTSNNEGDNINASNPTIQTVASPNTIEVNTNADCDLQNLAKCTVDSIRIAPQRQTDLLVVVKANSTNVITVDFRRGSIQTGSQIIVSTDISADTSGLTSAVLSIEILDLNFHPSNIQEPVEICFKVDSNINEDEACIATLNDSGEFKCHEKCPDKLERKSGGLFCDSVDHFTSFAVLFDGGEDSPTADDCTSSDRWILGSWYNDLILILSVAVVIIATSIVAMLLFTFVTPLRNFAIGEEAVRIQQVRAARAASLKSNSSTQNMQL